MIELREPKPAGISHKVTCSARGILFAKSYGRILRAEHGYGWENATLEGVPTEVSLRYEFVRKSPEALS